MWVADMDFACAPPIIEALRRRVDHGIYGYSNPPAGLIDATIAHLQSEYGWKIEPDWLIWLPGLVVGLNVVCRAFGREGADVLTAVPIYPPARPACPGWHVRPGSTKAVPCDCTIEVPLQEGL